MTDSELMQRFEAATLSGDEFPSREHVRVAWLYLRDRPLLVVLDRFRRHLRALAEALGVHGLYQETVTWIFLMLVHDRIVRSGTGGNWQDFEEENRDLFERSSSIMDRNYRTETWQSALAKERFLIPDGPPRLTVGRRPTRSIRPRANRLGAPW